MINDAMKHLITYTCIMLSLLSTSIMAQKTEWAGIDKSTCGQKGVMIGSSDPCPNCCYSWTPKTGLDFPDKKNPIASPDKPTTYTVTVVNEKLTWRQTDQVKVNLSFGELVFEPGHLEQGTEEIALVRLKNNTENYPTEWSLPEPFGCMIDPSLGDPDLATIHPGDQYGKLLVKVQNTNDEECYYIDTIPVNNGVKDLIAIDLNNPERRAMTGETLYLVGAEASDVIANLIAIPNEGGFKNGNPKYRPHLETENPPIDGDDNQEVTELPQAFDNPAVYQAGEFSPYDPEVTVVRIFPTESASNVSELINNMTSYLNEWRQASLDFEDLDIDVGGTPPGPTCPPLNPFSAEFNVAAVLKKIEVEKYNDPAEGEKQDISYDLGINVSGKAYHPALSRHFVKFGVGICSELYAGIDFENNFHLSFSSDESLPDPEWKMNDPQLEIAMTGTAGFSALLLSGTGLNLQASGSAAVSAKIFLDYKVATKAIVASSTLLPLTIKLRAAVVNQGNMGEFKPIFDLISEEIVLFKGFQTPPITLYQPPTD